MKIEVNKNLDKRIAIWSFVLIKVISYFLFAPFLFILWLDLIFIITILQSNGIIDIKTIFEQIFDIPYIWKNIYLWFKQYHHIDEKNLKEFMWTILFFLWISYAILDILIYILLKKHIKINAVKIVSFIMLFSYIFYVWLLFYFAQESWFGVLVIVPFITFYMLGMYVLVILSIKLSNFADLFIKEYLWQK